MKLSPRGVRISGSHLDDTICEVYYLSDDFYEGDCLLPDFEAGAFDLTIDLDGVGVVGPTGTPSGIYDLAVVCSDDFILSEDGYTCICGSGEYLDLATRKCVNCPVGEWNDLVGQVGLSSCKKCDDYFLGSTSLTSGNPNVHNCVCTPGFHLTLTEGEISERLQAKVEEEMGICEECPDGGKCAFFGVEAKYIEVQGGNWRASSNSSTLYECKVISDENVSARIHIHTNHFCAVAGQLRRNKQRDASLGPLRSLPRGSALPYLFR